MHATTMQRVYLHWLNSLSLPSCTLVTEITDLLDGVALEQIVAHVEVGARQLLVIACDGMKTVSAVGW
jgi:hypothetical protein